MIEINAKVFNANETACAALGVHRFEVSAWRPIAGLITIVITVERRSNSWEFEQHGAVADHRIMRWFAALAGFDRRCRESAAGTGLAEVLEAARVGDASRPLSEWLAMVTSMPKPDHAALLAAIASRIWLAALELDEPTGEADFADIERKTIVLARELGDVRPLLNVDATSTIGAQARNESIDRLRSLAH